MTVRLGDVVSDIQTRAQPLETEAQLDAIVDHCRNRRFVAIGEASHGTHEFYRWRAALSRRLIQEQDIGWIAVEGDWPDCWRIDRWVRGRSDSDLDARGVLAGFERWPTWMWANSDVADFLDWLRSHNASLPETSRVGFYGLDLYSLSDSLLRVETWSDEHAPGVAPLAARALEMLEPYRHDPHRYSWSTRTTPSTLPLDLRRLLTEVELHLAHGGDDAFDTWQNVHVAIEAERYYRASALDDTSSWNLRDLHMAGTVDRLSRYFGPRSRGLLWAHNTHVGDARGTNMQSRGLLNIGQLLREHYGREAVYLIGMASHRGTVLAALSWGGPETSLPVPAAHAHSHEGLLHLALGHAAVLLSAADSPWSTNLAGHRAIGVVYDPRREQSNFVPTLMGGRYDALLSFDETTALVPLHHERAPHEAEYETAPSGY